jgi:hypothetical protein
VFFHGNAANLSSLIEVAAGFAMRGFSFFAVDYRGYGASGGAPGESGLKLDARAAYEWVRGQGVAAGRIVLYGHSLGAALAAWLSVKERAACAVLEGSFPSVYAMARFHYPWLLLPEFLVRDRFETGRWIRGARCPVLVVHGEEDGISPVAFGRTVFATAPDPKAFVAVPGAGHNDMLSVHPDVLAALSRIVAGGARP